VLSQSNVVARERSLRRRAPEHRAGRRRNPPTPERTHWWNRAL